MLVAWMLIVGSLFIGTLTGTENKDSEGKLIPYKPNLSISIDHVPSFASMTSDVPDVGDPSLIYKEPAAAESVENK